MTFLETMWSIILIFVAIAYLMLLFSIIGDLFRDHKLNGWWKALWFVFLIIFPIITALVYVIARGKGMSERTVKTMQDAENQQKQYIRQVAGTSPAEQIATAQELLKSGSITDEEFANLKAHALAEVPAAQR